MNIRETVYGMHKQADPITLGTTIAGDTVRTASELSTAACVWLLAISAGLGMGIGYGASRLAAHGPQDVETAKKQYENERLKADLGYLSGKTKQEYNAFQTKKQPKPARVIA